MNEILKSKRLNDSNRINTYYVSRTSKTDITKACNAEGLPELKKALKIVVELLLRQDKNLRNKLEMTR
jgi:hypothetical protein